MRIRVFDVVLAGVLVTLGALVVGGSLAQDKGPVGPADPAAIAAVTDERPVVVAMFYSGFCSACQILDPKVDAVKPEFADRPVTFVTFDKTFSALGGGDDRAAMAAELGITDAYEKNKGKQGFALIIDPASGQTLSMLTMRNSEEDIRAELNRVLVS